MITTDYGIDYLEHFSDGIILQVFAIELVTFAVDFVLLAVEFGAFAGALELAM